MAYYDAGKRALSYIKPVGRKVTKKHKKPIRRAAMRAVDWFEKLTGFGDYTVKGNTLLTDNAPPMFQSSGQGLRVSHREYIGDIMSSTGFNLQSFLLNIGDKVTFPWLSGIAGHFEQYHMNGLVFEFRSTCGSAIASTNNALGVVVMATEYDVFDRDYLNKVEMQQSMFCCSGAPTKNLLHPIECDPSSFATQNFYVSSELAGGDARFTDIGKFQIATQGMQAADINLGELWVSYDVTLLKAHPKVGETLSPVSFSLANFSTANPMGDGSLRLGSEIVATLDVPASGQLRITLQAGKYGGKKFALICHWLGSGAITATSASAVLANCSTLSVLGTGTLTSFAQIANSGSQSTAAVMQYFQVNDSLDANASASVVITNLTLPTTPSRGECLLVMLDDDLDGSFS